MSNLPYWDWLLLYDIFTTKQVCTASSSESNDSRVCMYWIVKISCCEIKRIKFLGWEDLFLNSWFTVEFYISFFLNNFSSDQWLKIFGFFCMYYEICFALYSNSESKLFIHNSSKFCFSKIVFNWLDFNQMDPKKVKTCKSIFFVFVYLETIYR